MSTDADSGTTDQCKAITAGGERCSRPAGEDGFCFQHDASDDTVDEPGTGGDSDNMTNGDSESETDESTDGDNPESKAADAESESEEAEESEESESGNVGGILEVRGKVENTAADVVGRPLDAVIGINQTDDGWRAVIEVIERKSIPDTQDILGRYELLLNDESTVREYSRLDRYRRDDTSVDETSV